MNQKLARFDPHVTWLASVVVVCLLLVLDLVAASSGATAALDLTKSEPGGCPKGQISSAQGCVTTPVLLRQVKPKYPRQALSRHAQARVILGATVDAGGMVIDISVLSCTTPHVRFEDSAIKAVKKWRYRPASFGGESIPVIWKVVVDFMLDYGQTDRELG